MITTPYVNFSELSKKRDVREPEEKQGMVLKNGNLITVKLKNGHTLIGEFNGNWGEDNDNGIFVDENSISNNDIVSIENIDNKLDEVLKLAGVK